MSAYDLKDPSRKIGAFDPDTRLKLTRMDAALQVYQVLYEDPSGQKMEAFCRMDDVKKALSVEVPAGWLKGSKGYEQALALQKQGGIPILVWITWNNCPNCRGVDKYLEKKRPTELLRDYIRVVIDEKVNQGEGLFCKSHQFAGGLFYVISSESQVPVFSLWAWKKDAQDTHVILDGLEDILASKLCEVAKATLP